MRKGLTDKLLENRGERVRPGWIPHLPRGIISYSTIGCNSTGMEGGGAYHTGPQVLLLWLLLLYPTWGNTESCHRCHQPVYSGMTRRSLLRTHTHLDKECFDSSKLETCTENGETYWLAENLGTFAQWVRGECSEGERWVCFENNLGAGITGDGQYY